MFRELIEAVERFRDDEDFLPLGYGKKNVNWIIRIYPSSKDANIEGPFRKEELRSSNAPTRVRTGKPSEKKERPGKIEKNNIKPYLLIDNASYALGISTPEKQKEAELCHVGFVRLLEEAYESTKNSDIPHIIEYLKEKRYVGKVSDILPKDIVTFQVSSNEMLFEKAEFQDFWKKYLEKENVVDAEYCSVCGQHKPIIRTFPKDITIMGQNCQIASYNDESFNSYGKETELHKKFPKATPNSPICFNCAATITESLSFLLRSKAHHAVIAKDDAKGEKKYLLRNQLAVFWLKDKIEIEIEDQEETCSENIQLSQEDIASIMEDDDIEAPSKIEQLERLLYLPWHGKEYALEISSNHFYLAVLTPNKTRLVLREWMDVSLDKLLENLKLFIQAAKIVRLDGSGSGTPPIPVILSALKAEDTKSSTAYANIVRDLLRTAYKGQPPPEGLLRSALLRFRVPDKSKEKQKDKQKQMSRRHALASAMQLVLIYDTEEAKIMEKLNEHQKDTAYLCGSLLAILEDVQRRASDSKLNTTLVDSFFSAACTAPETTFSTLIVRATKSHFPQIRRKKRGYQEKEELFEKVMSDINENEGFPSELNVKRQALFCLGFYSQRAKFSAERAEKYKKEKQEKPMNQEVENE